MPDNQLDCVISPSLFHRKWTLGWTCLHGWENHMLSKNKKKNVHAIDSNM